MEQKTEMVDPATKYSNVIDINDDWLPKKIFHQTNITSNKPRHWLFVKGTKFRLEFSRDYVEVMCSLPKNGMAWKVKVEGWLESKFNHEKVIQQYVANLTDREPAKKIPLELTTEQKSQLAAGRTLDITGEIKWCISERVADVPTKTNYDPLTRILVVENTGVVVDARFLAASSCYFETLFFGGYNEQDLNAIPLSGIQLNKFLKFLRVLYNHQQPTTRSYNVLLEMADMYFCNDIFRKVEAFFCANTLLMTTNTIQLLYFCERYSFHKLFACIIATFKAQHVEKRIEDLIKPTGRDKINYWAKLSYATKMNIIDAKMEYLTTHSRKWFKDYNKEIRSTNTLRQTLLKAEQTRKAKEAAAAAAAKEAEEAKAAEAAEVATTSS